MSSVIDNTLAKSLIQEYRDQNSTAGGPGLLTDSGQFLNGFFIDRACLENILSNPSADGLHIYLAKHPEFAGVAQNTFTVVLVGAAINPEAGNGPNQPPYLNIDLPWEFSAPCPPSCGDF